MSRGTHVIVLGVKKGVGTVRRTGYTVKVLTDDGMVGLVALAYTLRDLGAVVKKDASQ